MDQRRGFTIVELIIVMAIMVILLMLSVLSISKNQANARDAQRNSDIAAIANGLETRYRQGNRFVTSSTGSYITPGSYPDIKEMAFIVKGTTSSDITAPTPPNGNYIDDVLPGAKIENFQPPNVTDLSGFTIAPCSTVGSCGSPLAMSATADTIAASAASFASTVPINNYYYEPIDANGKICNTTTCTSFNLYWQTEVDKTIHILRSEHQ